MDAELNIVQEHEDVSFSKIIFSLNYQEDLRRVDSDFQKKYSKECPGIDLQESIPGHSCI